MTDVPHSTYLCTVQTPDTSAAGTTPQAAPAPKTDLQFADFALSPALLAGVAELKYTQPTPVQQLVLAPALEGQDVAGQAPTGSGKTAAYGLALLQQVDPTSATMQALVLVLLFVFYCAMIFYFGAAFTKAYAHRIGLDIRPKKMAVRYRLVNVEEEESVQQ